MLEDEWTITRVVPREHSSLNYIQGRFLCSDTNDRIPILRLKEV
ncbi:hypothetical protein HMPREF9412_6230 [Paenibacillus sp. HGF5]|nr:hypothetical protein HMPREF9412_6230 [Paenibacillus sp. HGF5]